VFFSTNKASSVFFNSIDEKRIQNIILINILNGHIVIGEGLARCHLIGGTISYPSVENGINVDRIFAYCEYFGKYNQRTIIVFSYVFIELIDENNAPSRGEFGTYRQEIFIHCIISNGTIYENGRSFDHVDAHETDANCFDTRTVPGYCNKDFVVLLCICFDKDKYKNSYQASVITILIQNLIKRYILF